MLFYVQLLWIPDRGCVISSGSDWSTQFLRQPIREGCTWELAVYKEGRSTSNTHCWVHVSQKSCSGLYIFISEIRLVKEVKISKKHQSGRVIRHMEQDATDSQSGTWEFFLFPFINVVTWADLCPVAWSLKCRESWPTWHVTYSLVSLNPFMFCNWCCVISEKEVKCFWSYIN